MLTTVSLEYSLVRYHRCYHKPHNNLILSHFTDEETEALTAASTSLSTMIQPPLPSIHFRTETLGLEQSHLYHVEEGNNLLTFRAQSQSTVPSGSPQVWYKPVKTQIAAVHTVLQPAVFSQCKKSSRAGASGEVLITGPCLHQSGPRQKQMALILGNRGV